MPNLSIQDLIDAINTYDLNRVNALLRAARPSMFRPGSTERFNAYVTANNNIALRRAIQSLDLTRNHANTISIINRLLSIPVIQANAAANDNEALCIAAANGEIELVRTLLRFPCVKENILTRDCGALRAAANYNQTDVISELLQIPEVVNFEINAPEEHKAFTVAIKKFHEQGQDGAIQLLRNPEIRAHATQDNNRFLMQAIKFNKPRVVTELLSIDAVTALDMTCILDDAARKGRVAMLPEIMQVLDGNFAAYYNALLNAIGHMKPDAARFIIEHPGVRNYAREQIEHLIRLGAEFTPAHIVLANEFQLQPPGAATIVDTHTASVHKTASESATRLMTAYRIEDFTPAMADVNNLFANRMPTLIASIAASLKKEVSAIDPESVKTTINTAINYLQRDIEVTDAYGNLEVFKDPTSGIKLDDLFKSILVGINKLDNIKPENDSDTTAREDAYIRLCESIYLLHNEYGLNSPSCPPGFFNGLIYSQQTTLPHEVFITVQTKEMATTALKAKIRIFANTVLNGSTTFDNAEDFENTVIELAAEQNTGIHIMRELADEFYMLYGHENPAAARIAAEEQLNLKNFELFGCAAANFFTDMSFDYEALFNEASQATRASVARLKQ